jgi:hypothetical protein
MGVRDMTSASCFLVGSFLNGSTDHIFSTKARREKRFLAFVDRLTVVSAIDVLLSLCALFSKNVRLDQPHKSFSSEVVTG